MGFGYVTVINQKNVSRYDMCHIPAEVLKALQVSANPLSLRPSVGRMTCAK